MLPSSHLHPLHNLDYGRGNCRAVLQKRLSVVRTPEQGHLGPGPAVYLTLRQSALQPIRDRSERVNGIPPSDGWADRAKEPMGRTIPSNDYHASTESLGTLAAPGHSSP